ncbi:MAG: hypothetical protein K2H41_04560 [Acetatifactor sp.]|nr:hypothetical protein [Acetatifactor sp.]MDE6699830.1 hypothetical protein [Acetatifactor sp.]
MINLQEDCECKRCLKDCGCDEEQYKEYMELVKSDDNRGQIIFLRRQRTRVMEKLHDAQKEVDCIDYIIRMLEKEDL